MAFEKLRRMERRRKLPESDRRIGAEGMVKLTWNWVVAEASPEDGTKESGRQERVRL